MNEVVDIDDDKQRQQAYQGATNDLSGGELLQKSRADPPPMAHRELGEVGLEVVAAVTEWKVQTTATRVILG